MSLGRPNYRRGGLPRIRGAVVSDGDVIQPLRLMLLGGFTLLGGTQEIELPMSAQRVVAFLALRERGLSRTYLAGALWPDCSTERSLADLRTALWRANHSHTPIVRVAGMRLSLRPEVQVNVRVLMELGRAPSDRAATSVAAGLVGMSWSELSLDLLPDWYDDWLLDDRERVRHLRLHALELLTAELSSSGRHAQAIQAALAAVRNEPLRETSHAALIRAHLAEGNRSEAVRQFNRCRELLLHELGVEPPESISSLMTIQRASRGSYRSDGPAEMSGSSRSIDGAPEEGDRQQRPQLPLPTELSVNI